MRDPVKILIRNEEVTLEGIKQFYINVEERKNKFVTLIDLFERLDITQSVIYANTRRVVDDLAAKLNAEQFTVSKIHGELDAQDREMVMREFISGSSRVLVSTDLLARGIDVQQVSIVINYDFPSTKENYIHRCGRCGRFGRKGIAISLVTNDDAKMMREVESFYHTEIGEMQNDVEKHLKD